MHNMNKKVKNGNTFLFKGFPFKSVQLNFYIWSLWSIKLVKNSELSKKLSDSVNYSSSAKAFCYQTGFLEKNNQAIS